VSSKLGVMEIAKTRLRASKPILIQARYAAKSTMLCITLLMLVVKLEVRSREKSSRSLC
jgi:hypothetical protein